MKKITSNKKYIILIVLFLAVATIGFGYYWKSHSSIVCHTVTAHRTDLRQVVSLTGRVKSVKKINLSFERGGRLADIYVKNNDLVKAGQPLLELDNQDLKIKLNQAKNHLEGTKIALLKAQNQLDSQIAKLKKMQKGVRKEEINLAKTKVQNCQKQLQQAQNDLKITKTKAINDLRSVYATALSYLPGTIDLSREAIYQIVDLCDSYFNDFSQESSKVTNANNQAVELLLGQKNAGRWSKKSLSQLQGGAVAKVQIAENNPTPTNIDVAISTTMEALKQIKLTLNIILSSPLLPANEINNVSTEINYLENRLVLLNQAKQSIYTQKEANQLIISNSEIKLTQAQNNLALAKSELSVKESGYNPEDIRYQQSEVKVFQGNIKWEEYQVKQAMANVRYYQNEINKTILRSPINGIITNQNDLQIGEVVMVGTPIISVISQHKFKIEAYVSESDIEKVRVGDQANVTLDAYGDDKIFSAKVVKIDLGETMIEGVASYKVTLEFNQEDSQIKPGMTANIDILTAERSNVVALPWRAIIEKNGQKLVKIIQNGRVKEVKIKTGLYGSNGSVEIINGVKDGEKVCLP